MGLLEWYCVACGAAIAVLLARGEAWKEEARKARRQAESSKGFHLATLSSRDEWQAEALRKAHLLGQAQAALEAMEAERDCRNGDIVARDRRIAELKSEQAKAQADLAQARGEAAAQLEKAREAYHAMREAWRKSEGQAEQARGVIRRLLEPARDALGLPAKEEA